MKHVYTSFLTFTLLTLTATTSFAQGPNDSGTYYAAADGKKGAVLKTALCEIINPHTQRTYGNLWTDFQTTDAKANGKVWDMYSNKREFTFVTDQTGSAGYKKEGDNYNREHSFPKVIKRKVITIIVSTLSPRVGLTMNILCIQTYSIFIPLMLG